MASKDTAIAAIMEQLMAEGPQAMAPVVTALMNLAMRMEREQFLGAGHYERSSGRRGYANGAKLKKIDTPAGTLTLEVPKTAGTQKPFFPQSLERGRRACRAVMLCAAEMYVKGVSTRAVEKVLAEFGIEGLSSTQVSRAAALLDDELEAWRDRPLGCFRYLFLDARYEKTREHGVADDCAVLSAIGIEPSGKRRILGLSVAFSEAEVHWRAFLESLVARGPSADHAHFEPHRALDPARAETPDTQNTCLPQRGLPRPSRLRHPRRNRRAMGRLPETLCQLQQRRCRLMSTDESPGVRLRNP